MRFIELVTKKKPADLVVSTVDKEGEKVPISDQYELDYFVEQTKNDPMSMALIENAFGSDSQAAFAESRIDPFLAEGEDPWTKLVALVQENLRPLKDVLVVNKKLEDPLFRKKSEVSVATSPHPEQARESFLVEKKVTYTSQSHIAAPQNVTYTEAAPVTTYTTYSPNQYTNAPSTVTYLENAPKTYTTYSQSHVAAPQTISYHTNGIGSSNQVIYSNPTVGENPVTTIYNADGTTRRVSRSRVTSSQVITTNSLGSTTDFNGLKLVGTYYDDNNTTTRNL